MENGDEKKVAVKPTKSRSTTNPCVLLGGLVVLGAFVGVGWDTISHHDPHRLLNGVDYNANFCDTSNDEMDLTGKTHAYQGVAGDPHTTVCVEGCPETGTHARARLDPAAYVCRYSVNKDTANMLEEEAAGNCWFAVATRAYLRGCFRHNSLPFTLSAQRGHFSDLLVERAGVGFYSAVLGLLFAYLWSFTLRVAPSLAYNVSFVMLHAGLFLFVLFAWWEARERGKSARSRDPVIDSEIDMADNYYVLAIGTGAFFIASFTIFLLQHSHARQGLRAIALTSSPSSPSARIPTTAAQELLPFVLAAVMTVSGVFALSVVASVVARDVVVDAEGLQSGLVLSQESTGLVVAFALTQLWVMHVLVAIGQLVVAHVTATNALAHNTARASRSLFVVLRYHLGTAFAFAFVQLLLDPLIVLIAPLAPSLVSRLPLSVVSSSNLVRVACRGSSLQRAAAKAEPRTDAVAQILVGSRVVCELGCLLVAVVGTAVAAVVFVHHTNNDAVTHSMLAPLCACFVSTLYIARLILLSLHYRVCTEAELLVLAGLKPGVVGRGCKGLQVLLAGGEENDEGKRAVLLGEDEHERGIDLAARNAQPPPE